MSRSRIEWNRYVDEFVAGLRAREDCAQLLRRLNGAFGTSFTKQNLVMAMCPKSPSREQDGPLLRLLDEKYPDQVESLRVLFRGACNGTRRIARDTAIGHPAASW